MKLKGKVLLIAITLMIAFAGCKKYPDGPGFSPWPKKWRLDGTWKISEYVNNGVTTTPTDIYTITFKHNGDFSETSGAFSVSGKWAWADSKDDITITIDGTASTSKILKLEMKQLWFQDPSSLEESHYVPN